MITTCIDCKNTISLYEKPMWCVIAVLPLFDSRRSGSVVAPPDIPSLVRFSTLLRPLHSARADSTVLQVLSGSSVTVVADLPAFIRLPFLQAPREVISRVGLASSSVPALRRRGSRSRLHQTHPNTISRVFGHLATQGERIFHIYHEISTSTWRLCCHRCPRTVMAPYPLDDPTHTS